MSVSKNDNIFWQRMKPLSCESVRPEDDGISVETSRC